MTQAAFAPEVCRSWGSSLWIGISSVWVSEATRPPKQSTTTGSAGWSRRSRGGTTLWTSDTDAGYI